MSKTVIYQSERIYGFLINFYPERYRVEFAEEMKFVFSELLQDAYAEQGDKGIINLWFWTMIDTVKSLVVQHIENQKGNKFMNKYNDFLMSNKIFLWGAIGTVLLLMIPFVGMLVSDSFQWGVFDFVFMGGLIFGAGAVFVFVARQMNNIFYRLAVGIAGVAGFLLVWINAAVGIIGDDEPANMMYLGVLAIAFLGAIVARFKAAGMYRAMLATTTAHTIVAVIAFIFYPNAMPGQFGILAINAFFILAWLSSGLLFRNAVSVESRE
ncbi:MAG TPA: hypothetical protein DIW23_01890 [Anaerolineae bacterium]|nr:hypothetical protein [Anaerolineae bacterium]